MKAKTIWRNGYWTQRALRSGHSKPNIQREHRLRLRLVSDGHFSPDEVKTVTASSKFDQIVQDQRWSCLVTSYYGPLGHSCLFDLYEVGDNGQILNGRVIEAVLSFLQDRYSAQPRNSEVFNSLCDVPRTELIQYILGAIVGGVSGTAKDLMRIRFDKLRSFSKYAVGLGDRDCDRETWLNSITAGAATSNLTRDRKWEIDCLRKEIGLAPVGVVLAVTCPVLIEDKNHKCIAEIDGVFVRVDGIQVDVTFLEAKYRQERNDFGKARS